MRLMAAAAGLFASAAMGAPPAWLEAESRRLENEVIAWRRDFHQNPEVWEALGQ
jgi:hypothetical protein